MFTLREAWLKIQGQPPYPEWDGRLICCDTDAATTFRTNRTQGFMAAYTFTLVLKGWLSLLYANHEITLVPGDLYIYSPGLAVSVNASSEDYRGICLLADERLSQEVCAEHDLAGVVLRPVVELHEPKLHLPFSTASAVLKIMEQIRDYCLSPNRCKEQIVRQLYAVFLYELKDFQDISDLPAPANRRAEDLYIRFLQLLPAGFAEHHDIAYYADSMGITPIYLSRIVRAVSGRTVMDHINDFLMSEARSLLRTSRLDAAQIAGLLHFADVSSFSKFFSRRAGVSPRRFRNLEEQNPQTDKTLI